MRQITSEDYCNAHSIACAEACGDHAHANLIRVTTGLAFSPRQVIQLWEKFVAMKYRMPDGWASRMLKALEIDEDGNVEAVYMDLPPLNASNSPALT